MSSIDNTTDYLQDLKTAIGKIRIDRCCYKKEDIYLIENERSFAYELYRVWSTCNYTNLIINAEVSKHIDEDFEKEAKDIFGKETHYFIPDMVLHHSQYNSDKQEIICEIKIKTNLNKEKFLRDIKKLHSYTKTNGAISHPFNIGVFILVSGDFADLKKIITKEDFDNMQTDKIVLFVCTVKNNRQFCVEDCTLKSFIQNL